MLLAWFGQMARVLVPGRCFYIWGGYMNWPNYCPALAEVGLRFAQGLDVSIHAPARERTTARGVRPAAWTCFNPRSRAGANRPTAISLSHRSMFQSTLPRGSERRNLDASDAGYSFQSTLPRGSEPDARRDASLRSVFVSIHAPARERTPVASCGQDVWTFQSTLPRGSELVALDLPREVAEFQSTLPRGSEPDTAMPAAHCGSFQSTLPRGSERLRPRSRQRTNRGFNPRSRAGANCRDDLVAVLLRMFQSTLPRGSEPGQTE